MTDQSIAVQKVSNACRRDLTPRRRHLLLSLILAGYVIITLLYGLINPLFEAPDEHWHYFTAQYIADNNQLPYVAPGNSYDEWLSQEAAQPPLYYMLGSLLITPIDTAGGREEVWFNKFRSIGDASDVMNLNRFVHTEAEAWPWEGYALAAHILRGLSTLLGLGTLICIYLTGRIMWANDAYRALLATALVAFLPQYNFHHAAVTNDALIIFLVSLSLWQLARLWQTEVTTRRLLLLGLTLGLAVLAKNTGLTLLVYAVGVLLLIALRNARMPSAVQPELSGRRLMAATALWVILPAILIAGGLWARNWSLYGDFSATNQFIRLAGGDRNYTLLQVLRESRGLWVSIFAIFGWFNVRAPNWVYWFWSGLAGLAVAGAVWRTVTTTRLRGSALRLQQSSDGSGGNANDFLNRNWLLPFLLAMWVVAIYGSLTLFMLKTEAAQGRLLFPALLPVALGTASGLTATAKLRHVSPVFPVLALFITLYCLFFVVRPVYQKPPIMFELPAEVEERNMDMGEGITLVGAEIDSRKVAPGGVMWMTLYWRGDNVAEVAPEFVVSVFGRDNQEIGKVHSYHGRGLFPAGLWPEGQIIADRVGLRIDETAQVPVLAHIDTTILGGKTARVGTIKIASQAWPPAARETLAQIGLNIDLLATAVTPERARPGSPIRIDVRWQASGTPSADYTTLIHVGWPDEMPLATGDRPPLNGSFPTRVWEQGEQIDDFYTVALPQELAPGRYPIWIGMYEATSLARLPVTIEGAAQPHDVYLAGWVDVE